MTSQEAVIQNEAGIHCRPAAEIMKALKGYEGRITLKTPNGNCTLRSVMDLLGLGLPHGIRITLTVDGPDEENQARELKALFERNFDFPNAGQGMA